MLTIAEFNAAMRTYIRRVAIFLALAVAGTLAPYVVFAMSRDELLEYFHRHLTEVGAEWAMVIFPLTSTLLFLGILSLVFLYRGLRDPRLSCPHCRKFLPQATAIVIATRNCPGCGRRILAEPE